MGTRKAEVGSGREEDTKVERQKERREQGLKEKHRGEAGKA
jgi:hypothetical protein